MNMKKIMEDVTSAIYDCGFLHEKKQDEAVEKIKQHYEFYKMYKDLFNTIIKCGNCESGDNYLACNICKDKSEFRIKTELDDDD